MRATLHQHLNLIEAKALGEAEDSQDIEKDRLVRGRIIKIDIHVSEYFGDQKLPDGHHGPRRSR